MWLENLTEKKNNKRETHKSFGLVQSFTIWDKKIKQTREKKSERKNDFIVIFTICCAVVASS